MKKLLQVLLFFLASTIVIIMIGGSADFLATLTSNRLVRTLGLEEGSFLAIIFLALAFVVMVMALVPIVLLVRTRFVKPIVFISFKHIHEKKAIELEEYLNEEGFGVERLAFSKNYKHDEVVGQVRKKLQKSHVLVAIPDAEEASFVDAELLAASTLKIPIVLLKYQANQAQPGTLLLGYPVFDYNCIKAKAFQPLFRFLLFATRHRRDYFSQVGRIWRQLFDPFTLLALSAILIIFLTIKLVIRVVRYLITDVIGWEYGNLLMESDDLTKSVLVMLIVGFTIYTIGKAIHTLRVARQATITGADSYQTFNEEFSFLKKDREMMDCIALNQLEAKA